MEKRLIAFWLVTGLIFMAYFQYQARQQAALQKEAEQRQAEVDKLPQAPSIPSDGQPPEAAQPPGDAAGNPPVPTDRIPIDSVATDNVPADGASAEVTEAPIVESLPPVEHVVLGSLATGSPYTMAVYLTNEGAGVERIELNEARYADREDRSGYLGFLAMNYADAGCRIQTVAPGSPAAVAKNATPGSPDGLLVGDEIVSVDKKPVATPIELDRILEKTRPGESVSLGIRRTENGDVREIEFLAPLIRRPLAIVQSNRGDELPLAQNGSTSFQMTISQLDHASVPFGKDELANLPSLLNGRWSTHRIDDHSVEFRRNLTSQDLRRIGLSGKFEIVKRYRLAENPVDERASGDPQKYHLELDIEIHNRSTEAHRIAWRLDGANGVPTEGWWYLMKTHPRSWGAAGARDVIYREANGLHQMLTSASIIKQAEDKNSPETTVTAGAANLEYIGVDTQYFSIVLQSVAPTDAVLSAAGTPSVTGFTVSRAVARLAQPVDPQHKRVANTTCRVDGPLTEIAAGGTYKQSWRIFAGPKDRAVLEAYGLNECIVYGWGIFAAVAKPMTRLLHGLYAVVGNFGVAIILLTVVVRGCMFPLSRQQVASAKRMQELGPEMKRIAEVHKTDMEAKAKAQQELLRKHNVNPLSGCLPGLLQLPIFIGLYRCLNVDIALRGAPLVPGIEWCSNLAAPDQLTNWASYMPEFIAGPNGYLGPYLNVLPMISCGLFLVQQKLFTPPPTDEQQEMQHKMMSFMTLFMGVLFFKVPSGLCLYFISSSLWALAERKLLPKSPPAAAVPATKLASPIAPSSGPKDANSIVNWFQNRSSNGNSPPEESRDDRKKRRTRKRT